MAPVTLAEFREKQKRVLLRFRRGLLKEEGLFIARALDRAGGNLTQASRDLGVTNQALQFRLDKLNMRGWLAKCRASHSWRQPPTSK